MSTFGLTDADKNIIAAIFKKYPQIDDVILFGSRAMDRFKPASDIDFAVKGKDILEIIGTLSADFEESDLIYEVDVVAYDTITSPSLREHIDRVGKIFYSTETMNGKHLLILGLARQGTALARFAVQAGAMVTISDLRPAAILQAEMDSLADLEINFGLGSHPLTLLAGVDLLAISGGVPADAPFVQAARERGIPISNDSLEFVKRCPTQTIGITGSAGKTTTTALVGAMGRATTHRTWVGGNIGSPLIAHLPEMAAGDIVVQELSSFQLELWTQSPAVAAVLNITANHLDRHKTMAQYRAAKANILRHQSAGDIAVLSADDAGAMGLSGLVNGRLRQFSLHAPVTDGAYLQDDTLWLTQDGQKQAICTRADIQLRGQHNIANVLAAITLADSAGIAAAAMLTAIRNFSGVEHRLEYVATVDGVAYINDSIATAPERALAALSAFDAPIVLLAGGKDKDMVWETWADVVSQRVKHLVLFGALAPMLAEKMAGRVAMTQVETIEEAIEVGRKTAVFHDIILLSPGGTSYDAFVDFAERGDLFKKIVLGM